MKEWGLERYEIRTFPSIIWVSNFPSFIPELGQEEVPKHYCDSTNNKLPISSREWADLAVRAIWRKIPVLRDYSLQVQITDWPVVSLGQDSFGPRFLNRYHTKGFRRMSFWLRFYRWFLASFFCCWFFFFNLKKILAVPQGLWDLSSPTSDRTLASCIGSCESGIPSVHFLLVKIISIGTYLITSSSEITVSIFCWGSASKASKPRTAPSLNSTKGSVPCIECILYTSADN